MHDILISARHVLAMNAFVNKSTLAFLKVYYIEDIHIIDNRYQSRVDEMVEILYDPNSETKVIRIGYDLLRQGKRLEFVFTRAVIARALIEKASKLSKPDNHLKLDCMTYTNTVEAVDSSPAVITFIEIEHQKHLSARYFIEKLCSLIANTDAFLQFIKMDESQGIIGNRKRVRNEVMVEVLVIKNTDFNNIATSQNLSSEEAEVLKFDQEYSITNTIALKHFYMQNLYCKGMSIKDWNNICNRKFIEIFSSPET
ncbi:2518_t:CDS:2 [Funneliformis geosporum]|uniref:2518_t:CDS:1 n=1 Tax=Funneliformis geosporum TaxID=1117311 RepID=A0A9W4WP90_9GLOM|nr:2518_t:CDS:2 [Funneliformis geosporum]